MKKQDKFEEYLRKEMGSMEYDGEDRMWEDFKGQLPAATPLEQFISWSIPVAIIGLVGLGVYWYSGSQVTEPTLTGKNETSHVSMSERSENTLEETTTILTENNNENNRSLDQKENEKQEDGDIVKNKNVANSQLEVNDNAKEKYSGQRKIVNGSSQLSGDSQKKRASDLGTANFGQERNIERTETTQSLHQSSLPTQSEIQTTTLQSKKSQSVQNAGDGSLLRKSDSELNSQNELSLLAFLEAKESVLILDNSSELIGLKPGELNKKRLNIWSGFLGAGTGVQEYQLYTVGVNYLRPISKRFNLNLSLGLQSELGNIVSQDSIVKEIGVAIIETRTDKDLNDLLSIYLSAVPLFQVGQFGIGIGPRLSYGVYNRYRIVKTEASANLSGLNSFGFPFPQESFITQDWESLNRLRVGGDLVLRYQSSSRFGMELHLSKNFNKLINDNLAITNRSNSPLTIGLQLNYILSK